MLDDLQLIVYSYLNLEEVLILTKDKPRDKLIKIFDISNLDIIVEYRDGNRQTVKHLINKNSLVKLPELIQSVAVGGDLTIIKAIHRKIMSDNLCWLYFHATHAACYYGHLHVLKYFVSVGQALYLSHLESAIRHNHLEIVKYLLDLGVKPIKQTEEMTNNKQILKYLKQSNNSCCIIQ